MALKFKFKTREEIPAEHLPLYTERDGAWLLDVDGAVEKAKLDEARNHTAAVSKERDELTKRFEGIDPEEARALLAEKQKREEEKLLKGGDDAASEEAQRQERERIEKVIESRVKGVKGELEKQVTSLTSERDALTARLTAIQIDQGVITVATKRGLQAGERRAGGIRERR
jgi:alpha-galactosidase/6-phospho-beta-glucosidase family protein